MRISYFSIISISVFIISLAFTTSAFAQNNTAYSSSNDLGDGNVFFMTAKDLFLPGDLVEINGSLITTNPIVITLDDPHDEIVTSKTTFSDRDGYFTLELKIPTDAEAGIWKIVGTSGIYHKELNFTITGNSNMATTCYAGNLCSTPIQTTDQNGKNLTTHYETGILASGYANPGPPPDPLFLTDNKGSMDSFLTNHQILIRADTWPGYDTKTMDIGINMTSDTGFAFYATKHLIFDPNANHVQQIIWQFIPTKVGNYTVEKFSNGIHTSSTFFSVFDSKSSSNPPVLVSPLRQFKWGILKESIQCQADSVLVFKTTDGSPACVKPDTSTKLVTRDWGKVYASNQFDASSISNFQPIYDDATNSTKQCEIPFEGKEGYIPVMYMPINSVGKICVEYSSNYAAKVNLMFYDAIPSQNSSKSITVIAQPFVIPEGKSDVVFTIQTSNQTGFFGAELFCIGMPFAVGYDDQSNITANDFPWMQHGIIHCPAAIYTTQVLGVHGIRIKYVPSSLID